MRPNTFRIFLSSTFGDFQAEREALRKEVWPRLEQHCKAQGVSFEVVDLRWGISEADGNSHETLRICLDEIAHCQRLSPKPNFLLMVGNRYGWRPLPSEIPKEEFDRLLEEFDRLLKLRECTSDDHKLLMSAYQLDENALPQHYCLKPKGADWGEIESKLFDLLRRIGGSDYLLSATHLEIIKGALKGPDAHDHVFGFIRDIDGLDINSEQAKLYTDITEPGVPDDEANKLLDQLRDKIKKTIPEEHRYEHSVQWKQGTKGQLGTEYIEQLCQRVQAFLLNIIDQELSQRTSDPFDQELQHHRDFSAERLKMFMGRTDELALVKGWAQSALATNGGLPLIVHGPGGIGKSAFMAKVAAEIEDSQPDTVVIQRFIGASPQSSALQAFLGDLLREIARRYEQAEALPEGGLKELIEELPKRLSWATSDKPLLLVIDALDQFDATRFEARHHQWLPKTIPAHVAVVLSVLDGEIGNTAIRRYPQTEALQLPPFNREDGQVILDTLLLAGERVAPERKRKLTDDQYAAVLNAFEKYGQPLFLSLAAGIVRRWKSWEPPESLPDTIEALVERVVKSLRHRHGQVMADRALDYLVASRSGLSDEEILGLLWADDEAHIEFNDQRQKTGQPLPDALPPIIWSRIYFELATYLAPPQSVDGALLHKFFHRIIGETVEKISLTSDKALVHGRIADYFSKQPLFIGCGQEKTPNLRKLMEEPWQWIQAGKYDEAEALLTNFDFAMAKCKANRFADLLEDFRRLVKAKQKAGQPLSKNVDIWQRFMGGNAHILNRAVPEWTADRILLQLAVEHADNSPVTQAAESWLSEGNCDWLWLRNPQRLTQVPLDPCLLVFEGHTYGVRGAIQLADRRLLSWSDDETLRLWDRQTGEALGQPLDGHSGIVLGALQLADGCILSWSKDRTLRLWDGKTGLALRQPLTGHDGWVMGALQLSDGRILSWSQDRTLRLWDGKTGLALRQPLTGHEGGVMGALQFSDGRILSWSDDKTLRLWDLDVPVTVGQLLTGHEDGVMGALQLSDGRILSWSQDRTLRLWDGKTGLALGQPLTGHEGGVMGALQLSDGRILSWSYKTLRLWDLDTPVTLGQPLAGHAEIKGAVELVDGRFLSCSSDGKLYLWDKEGEAVGSPLNGHGGSVYGARQLADGLILSWSKDSTLRLWDMTTSEVIRQRLEGHHNQVRDVIQLSDGRILSCSDDTALRMWDARTGTALGAPLAGHRDWIFGITQLVNGRVLSWSKDQTLRLWEEDGKPVEPPLEGHGGSVYGALQLADGRILSWSYDNTLRFWDGQNGVALGQPLEGHSGAIRGALQIADGRILSWSMDETLRLWEIDGKPVEPPMTELCASSCAKVIW